MVYSNSTIQIHISVVISYYMLMKNNNVKRIEKVLHAQNLISHVKILFGESNLALPKCPVQKYRVKLLCGFIGFLS